MSSRTRDQLEKWIKNKSVIGNTLDVGGCQLPVEGRIKYGDGSRFVILDLPHPHEIKKPADIVWDLNEPITLESSFDRHDWIGQFDNAACLEVSEYWYDPLTALKNIAMFLRSGGRLFISFHFVYPVHNPVANDFLRYTRAGAIQLLDKAGFDIEEITPRTALPETIKNFNVSEGMRPARGYEYHDEIGLLIEARKR